jgi:hypothetical protein
MKKYYPYINQNELTVGEPLRVNYRNSNNEICMVISKVTSFGETIDKFKYAVMDFEPFGKKKFVVS